MQKALLLTTMAIFSHLHSSQAAPPPVFGKLDVIELFQDQTPWIQEAARAVALQVPKVKNSPTDLGICSDEPFTGQTSVGNCTAFLIGPKLLLTAGHCVPDPQACQDTKWVFDFQLNSKLKTTRGEEAHCAHLIVSSADNTVGEGSDYALVELDREIKGRPYLKLSPQIRFPRNTPLTMIGHPLGLPMKVTRGNISNSDNTEKFLFPTDLDAFPGNSGSPVFDSATHSVVGILVRGGAKRDNELYFDPKSSCYRLARCGVTHECDPMEAMSTTAIGFLNASSDDLDLARFILVNGDQIGWTRYANKLSKQSLLSPFSSMESALHYATVFKSDAFFSAVATTFGRRPDLGLERLDSNGQTALSIAVSLQYAGKVEILLKLGAQVGNYGGGHANNASPLQIAKKLAKKAISPEDRDTAKRIVDLLIKHQRL